MKIDRIAVSSVVSAVLCVVFSNFIVAEESIKYGLQVGELATPFYVRDCTGPAAGKTLCYFCRYGRRPVVSIFTREMNDEVIELLKQIDSEVGKHRAQRMAAFVVLLTDAPFATEKLLKTVAASKQINRVPLTIYRDTSTVLTDVYRISSQAETTVMMWRNSKIRINRVFTPDSLDAVGIRQVIKDTTTILK
jgi:hypothetical protein